MKFNFTHDLSGEFVGMLKQAKPATASDTSYGFKWDYLLDSIMSKHPGVGGSPQERRQAAIQKIAAANSSCERINRDGYRDDSLSFRCIIARAAQIARTVLGPFDVSVWERARFTSGSTTSRTKRKGDPYFKYSRSQPVDVTPRCHAIAYAIMSATPRWAAEGALHNIIVRPNGTVTTVPKNSKIDRCIEQQPDLNAMCQKALGLALDDRLARVGIDLHNQESNQALAWVGSFDGSLATIDLSAASDSIAYRLVMDIIPPDWFDALDRVRVPTGFVKNPPSGVPEVIRWELFSTMGNGATFGLESLIFYCLAKAVIEEAGIDPVVGTNLAIYGDDIIVPSSVADRLIWVLHACGFTTNGDKTFTSGPFRESCGRHYYNGDEVTPIYIRAPIDSVERVIWFLNALRRWAYDEHTRVCDPAVQKLWLTIRRKYVDSRLLGGENIDDILSVYSPPTSNPCVLKYERVTKTIGGWRSYMRWFQYQSSAVDVRYATILTLEDMLYWHIDPSNPQVLSRLCPDKVTVVDRDTWLYTREYLFPSEVTHP